MRRSILAVLESRYFILNIRYTVLEINSVTCAEHLILYICILCSLLQSSIKKPTLKCLIIVLQSRFGEKIIRKNETFWRQILRNKINLKDLPRSKLFSAMLFAILDPLPSANFIFVLTPSPTIRPPYY